MGKQIPVTGWYLEKVEAASNTKKFYTVLLCDNGVAVMAWGRIGAKGQSQLSRQVYSQAKAVALRQVYKKQSEGYKILHDELKLTIDEDVIDNACRRSMPDNLLAAFYVVRDNPRSGGDRAVVMKHYDDFAAKAQELLNAAPDMTFEEMQARTETLKESWDALRDKHDETAVVVSLLEQTLLQRLMSGAV